MPENTRCSLEDMSLILAHRMQSILTGIGGFAEMLVRMVDSDDARDLALRILEGTLRLEYIVQDLRYFSQPEAPVPVPVSVQELVQRIQSVLVFGTYEGYRIQSEVPGEVRVQVDPRLFAQAMIALIQNAYEAHPSDAEEPILIHIDADSERADVVFSIWNQGVIPDTALPHIFKPFFTTKVQNMGLGLPIARRIAEAHGGSLTLTCNDPDRGVIFSLVLPTVQEAHALQERKDGHTDVSAKSWHRNP